MYSYQDFINESETNILRIQAENLLKETDAYQNEDGTWSSNKSLNLSYAREISNKGKLLIKFKKIKGGLRLNGLALTTLEGCPETVLLAFNASNNDLTDLKGGPKIVGGDYIMSNNYLTSLEGMPNKLYKTLDLSRNRLTNIIGSPLTVKDMDLTKNPITSLEGLPKLIRGTLSFWVDSLPDSEKKFMMHIEKNQYQIEGEYFLALLKFLVYNWGINPKIHHEQEVFDKFKDAVRWPEGFLTKDLLRSIMGISKFNI